MNRQLGLVIFATATAAALAWACSEDSATPPSPQPDGGGGATTSSSGATSSSGDDGTSGSSGTPGSTTPLRASATIAATTDAGTITGTADFVETGSVVKVTINITAGGLPAGDHGIHIHDNPSCDMVDGGAAAAAGAHWNPLDAGHNLPSIDSRHLGDLGNLTVDANGVGKVELVFATSKAFYVHDGPYSVVNHAVIFHAAKDDGTPPIGNSGGRQGCGVIKKP
jgi:Cu-Zn family superoxide dismutase